MYIIASLLLNVNDIIMTLCSTMRLQLPLAILVYDFSIVEPKHSQINHEKDQAQDLVTFVVPPPGL